MLHVIVTTAHANEGLFPTYPQGTAVDLLAPCDEFFDWHACRIQGRDTYVYVHMLRATARSRRTTTRPNWTWRRAITWRCWASRAPGCMRAMRRVAAADGFRPRRRAL